MQRWVKGAQGRGRSLVYGAVGVLSHELFTCKDVTLVGEEWPSYVRVVQARTVACSGESNFFYGDEFIIFIYII